MFLGTLRGTQIHSCFCKSLIASGFGKEGWLWGGKYASHRSRRPSPSYGYEGTEARRPRGGGPGDGKKVRWRDGATETGRRCHGDRETETEDRKMERWRDEEVEQGHGRQPSVMHVVTET